MKKAIYLVLSIVLISTSLVLVGVLVGSKLSNTYTPNTAADQAIPFDSSKESLTVSSSNTIAIPGFEKIAMKAGTTEQTVKLYNPDTNKCYFRISILLADGTELYQSGLIKPGHVVDTIEISHPLKAGLYKNATLRYDCYAIDDQHQLNGAQTVFDLEVLP